MPIQSERHVELLPSWADEGEAQSAKRERELAGKRRPKLFRYLRFKSRPRPPFFFVARFIYEEITPFRPPYILPLLIIHR